MRSPSLHPEWRADIKEWVRGIIREDILDVERELEKRIKAQVLKELHGRIQKRVRGGQGIHKAQGFLQDA